MYITRSNRVPCKDKILLRHRCHQPCPVSPPLTRGGRLLSPTSSDASVQTLWFFRNRGSSSDRSTRSPKNTPSTSFWKSYCRTVNIGDGVPADGDGLCIHVFLETIAHHAVGTKEGTWAVLNQCTGLLDRSLRSRLHDRDYVPVSRNVFPAGGRSIEDSAVLFQEDVKTCLTSTCSGTFASLPNVRDESGSYVRKLDHYSFSRHNLFHGVIANHSRTKAAMRIRQPMLTRMSRVKLLLHRTTSLQLPVGFAS